MKNVTVLIMDDVPDRHGDVFDPKGVAFKNPIPLVLDNRMDPRGYLGIAVLKPVGKRLKAELIFETPLGEYIESHARIMYPSVSGVIKKRKGSTITEVVIDRVSLSERENSDPRIKGLKR